MIPDDVVERVREQADIVQVIGEHVKLKRVGTSYRGPCPFHQGKDANFSVSPKGGYHCFVCHEKGDVFTFVQKRLGLDFVGAVKYVGEKAGVEVTEVSRSRDAGPDPRERFWEINAAAADWFSRALWGDAGAAAREYLEGRDFGRDLAERFGLGFAPRGEGLREHMESLGYDVATLATAGLYVVREEGEDPRPRFRNRLIFPIYDAQGRVIAFGGRVIGPSEPKYLNSPESPTFQKSHTLYGLNWAKQPIRRDDRVMLVEGYFDCVRLMAAGIETVVAPMGTALTDAQADLIRKYTSNAFLLYDSDEAGLKATFRNADVLLKQSCKVLVVSLPEGEDPDTYVRRHGREGLERQVAAAIDVFERKIQILQVGGWFADLRRKRVALDRLLPTLLAAADPITRSLYVARAAEVVGVTVEVLEREIRNVRGEGRPQEAVRREPDSRQGASVPGPSGTRRPRAQPAAPAERELLRVLLHRRQNVERVVERVGPASFRDATLAQILTAMVDAPDAPLDTIATALDDDGVAVLNQLTAQDGGLDDPARVIEDCIAVLQRRELGDQIDDIDRELPLASDMDKDKLVSEKQELMRQIRELGGNRWKTFGGARP
ncbi:MAG: DNA primase [Gemmatimonadota bacterium]